MRAVRITKPGGPAVLVQGSLGIRDPQCGEVRVRVQAAGVNRADLLQRRGLYPAPAGWPADIPGLEYAGEVEAVGAGVDRWQLGDRVMGLVGGGGYAEYVVVPEAEALAIPPGLRFEEAAALPEAFITAHDALFTLAGLRSGERLLIHAIGSGVGTAALQLAGAAGAQVIGTSRSAWKLERARELGLELAVDSAKGSFGPAVERHTKGSGVDVVLDLIGGAGFQSTLGCLAARGRLVLVGLTAGRDAAIDLGIILRRRLTVIGTALRSRPPDERRAVARRFEDHVIPLLSAGLLRPVLDRVYSFEKVQDAHHAMEANANFGKIVLKMPPK